jgi:hypothetical protein
MLGGAVRGVIYCRENAKASVAKESFMRMLSAAAVMVLLLMMPAYAQTPNINLIPELSSRTPEEKEADAIKEKAYRDSLRKIPDAKASSDPWGTVRSNEAPKAAASPPAKPKAKAKIETQTGSSAQRSQ